MSKSPSSKQTVAFMFLKNIVIAVKVSLEKPYASSISSIVPLSVESNNLENFKSMYMRCVQKELNRSHIYQDRNEQWMRLIFLKIIHLTFNTFILASYALDKASSYSISVEFIIYYHNSWMLTLPFL